ncbi:hypothetical protein PUN28_012577 [Cardiocondyla obscurior]|uniref:Uncharacterized protein n=1 Tax=Cardiocondyla obscurior TaxID=286306 RepID=A0AAW2FFG9_9HYME
MCVYICTYNSRAFVKFVRVLCIGVCMHIQTLRFVLSRIAPIGACLILCKCIAGAWVSCYTLCGSVVICIDSAKSKKNIDGENGERSTLVSRFLCGTKPFYDRTNRREMENMEIEINFIYIQLQELSSPIDVFALTFS